MSYKGHNPKRDENEPEIVEALQRKHCKVERMDWHIDLCVWRGRGVWLLEVKTAKGRLTKDQVRLRDAGLNFTVVRTPEEALRAVGL